jgi:hypothetical protein
LTAARNPILFIEGNDNHLTICVEAEQLSLKRIATHLIDCRRDSADIAKRVHSRSDIAWTPLVVDSPERIAAKAFGVTTVSMATDLVNRTVAL